MFGAVGDSAPDRWGRALIRRMELRRSEREGTAPRTLQEIDFLLLVDDEARQGALRLPNKKAAHSCARKRSSASSHWSKFQNCFSAAERAIEEKDTDGPVPRLFAIVLCSKNVHWVALIILLSISYPLFHTNPIKDGCMQSPLGLNLLVDKYAELLPTLDLNGDDQEEYSTMLLWLQNLAEGGTPNDTYVDKCLDWLDRFTAQARAELPQAS